ncbi:MAG: TVP38/TMEM64 family protein [Desulfovibrionales bacterium]
MINIHSIRAWLANRENWKTVLLPLVVIFGLFVAGRMIDIHTYLQSIQNWIWSLGFWGPVVYGAIYVAAMLLLLPGTPFTIVAALFFGVKWGFVTMVGATTVAAIAGFLIARYGARERVEKRFRNQKTFHKLTQWVEENHWLAIPFIRIMPFFPFAMNNYALGLTRISFWTFVITSEVVFIPMNAVLVLGASAIYSAMVQGEVSWWLILGSIGTGMIVLILGLLGKKRFSNHGQAEHP